jgi:aspartate racemase
MKTIGLIGGMSWESSAEYYRIINQAVSNRLGAPHSARTLMYSVDFGELEVLQRAGRWTEAGAMMADAAQRLERGGADFIVICANTMHKSIDIMQAAVHIPILHIVDPTATAIRAQNIKKVGLLGTRYTMEETFYTQRLEQQFGLEVLVPGPAERELVNRVIFDELVAGIINPTSRQAYRQVMSQLAEQGAAGIIFGCTEICLLVNADDSPVPVFDTTLLHAMAAVEEALKE